MTTAAAIALRHPAAAMLSEQVQSLDRHLRQCQAARSRWFGAAAWAELAHGLVAPRFVTTISIAVVGLAICSWWA
jgi:hypothetical protein